MKKENIKQVKIFDTTLRDGEQSPGASLNTREKVQVAEQLERLGVDIIEAGFPITSEDDFQAVCLIAKKIKNCAVCGLARAIDKDIDRAYEAVKKAEIPRIHTFISTSDMHLKYQMKKTRKEVLEMTRRAVKRARGYVQDVEFSAMDASRTDLDYLCQVVKAAIAEGAATINIPDSVGYAIPSQWGKFISQIIERIPRFRDDIVLSVHCHNDLGLATANSLAGVENGALQVECAINGLGERGGNASLEEVAMALKVRQDIFNRHTKINTQQIYSTSRLVAELTGIEVQRNKAIVGANAFSHEAGIHQDAILKKRENFEIMKAEDIGWPGNRLVLGKHSGRHAIKVHLEKLNIHLKDEELDRFYWEFKRVADRNKEVADKDLIKITKLIRC